MPDPVVFENALVQLATSTSGAYAELTGNKSVESPMSRAQLDDRAMGDLADASYPGIKNVPLTIVHRQDFTAGGVDAKIYPLWRDRRPIRVKIRPVDSAVAAANPSYIWGKAYIFNITPIVGQHGTLLENRVEIRLASGGDHFSRSTTT